MKKAVTVFVVLTPVAFLIWAMAFCLGGIMEGDMTRLLPYIKDMLYYDHFQFLFKETFGLTTEKIIAYILLGLLGVGLLIYFILPPIRKRFGYMWHSILAIIATYPMLVTIVDFDTYKEMVKEINTVGNPGQKVIVYFAIAAALLTTLLMFVCFILMFIDCVTHRGRKAKHRVPAVDEFGVVAPMAPVIGENGLSSKAIPASEPIEIKEENPELNDIRLIIREELEKMHSRLQVRQNVIDSLNVNSAEEIEDSKIIPHPIVIEDKKEEKVKENPVKIVIMTQESQAVTNNNEPETVTMAAKQENNESEVEFLVEPLVESEPELVEEPLMEELDEEPVQQIEEVPMEQQNEVEEVEEPTVLADPVIEEEPIQEEIEATPEEEIVIEEPISEEPATFEEEPDGLVDNAVPQFEEEPEPEEAEKIEELVAVPVLDEEPKPTYERISFMDRMINVDQEMKDHYNALKNEILAYGVNYRVSNSGDAFRLHTKTYVKITIAGKSLKLYLALDPKDYENSTIPFQDVSNKGIYKEIPFAFKVKSDLSMKRARELIAEAMAKDGLVQGEIDNIDYVEKLKDEIASQDSEE